jgi:hypothetical protein
MELFGETEKEIDFFMEEIFPKLKHVSFRLGGGTRKGFGAVKIISSKIRKFNLTDEADRTAYLEKSSSLNSEFKLPSTTENKSTNPSDGTQKENPTKGWTTYSLSLKPNDFFLFGSGLGDDEADMTPVVEPVVDYKKGTINRNQVLIPASSVKGALAHRVAFYYNILARKKNIGSEKEAVKTLFGCEKKGDNNSTRGCVLVSDIFRNLPDRHVFNHVCIDRFTGGAMAGFLFNEKVVHGMNQKFTLKLSVDNKAIADKDIETAFLAALDDLCRGLLPLGGSTNRGHGSFTGEILEMKEQNGK